MGAEKLGFTAMGFEQEVMQITEEMAESWRQNHGSGKERDGKRARFQILPGNSLTARCTG